MAVRLWSPPGIWCRSAGSRFVLWLRFPLTVSRPVLPLPRVTTFAFHAAVEYVDNRRVGAAAVGSIVHGVHYFELEVFQEVPLTVYIARCAVVFRTGGIGFQVHIHHRVVHLRFLEAGQGGVQAVFGIVYGGLPGLRGELLPHFLYRRAVCVRR